VSSVPDVSHSFPGEERDQTVHERHGLTVVGFAEEEDVRLALGFEPRDSATLPTRCEALVVHPAPRPQDVRHRSADEHPIARHVLQARRGGGQGVHPRVV
jgi:hypothetical protein